MSSSVRQASRERQTRRGSKCASGLAALVVVALICLASSGCNGLPGDCQDELRFHEINLMGFCESSGNCRYDGQTVACLPASQAYCDDLCGDAGLPDCVKKCVGSVRLDCPFGGTFGSGNWEFPLDALGSRRDGLSVLHVTLMGDYEGQITVSVDGKVLCTTSGSPEPDYYLTLDCPLPGRPSWVRVDASDYPSVSLREPTPTKHVQLCGG